MAVGAQAEKAEGESDTGEQESIDALLIVGGRVVERELGADAEYAALGEGQGVQKREGLVVVARFRGRWDVALVGEQHA